MQYQQAVERHEAIAANYWKDTCEELTVAGQYVHKQPDAHHE